MSANREEGFVVGRFQPFHNEHLDYVLAAKKMCKFLWVGLAKFDSSMSESAFGETHRDDPKNNPLTYFERVRIISEVLTGCGVNRGEFGFLPFPIDEPKKMPWCASSATVTLA